MARKLRVQKVSTDEKAVKKPLSGNLLFIIVGAIVIASFFAGTRSNQIVALVGPIFGLRVAADDVDLSSVQATYKALKGNFDGTLDDKALIEGANRGLVSAANDAYTLFMNAKEVSEFDNDLSGTIGGGIGAEISIRSGNITIIRVLKDNPAQVAGLAAGDIVLSVNDQTTTELSVEQAVALIRGEAGTTVKLSIKRGSDTKEFNVTRAVVTNPSVTSAINGGIGTLTITRFDSETGTLAKAAAKEFKNAGVKSVILDLRGNGGGYVDAAQDVAGLWLDGKVVVTERRQGDVAETVKAGNNALLAGLPTVVLVNGSSASASEIVAGALQDYKVAKLVGEKTFGKGSVQKLISLPEGAQLKVTVARWYTPNGNNITTEGITPDVVVALTQADLDAGNDPQLVAAKKELNL